jgi:putative endonuclease
LKKYFVYILRTDKNTLYTGYTVDLKKRLEKHRIGKGAKYTRCFKKLELVYVECLETKELALKREWQIKKLPKELKEGLVKQVAQPLVV